jgi:diaminopimelate epimerase
LSEIRFEKWQALGNDYLILEQDELPFELTPERVRQLCASHFGCHADGVLLLTRSNDERFAARLRIFNPDGSEAELSGNGARQAILYMHRHGWASGPSFAVETAAGPIRPTILDERTCRVEMGAAALRSPDFPAGGADGRGALEADGRRLEFQHVSIGNPQCVIEVGEALDALDLARFGPSIEHHELFPNRTNVAFTQLQSEGRVRARIWERGVGETLSSGTGACGSAVAAVLRGATSPVTVELDGGELLVEVEDNLDVVLTGWAEPVFTGALSAELGARLAAAR